MGDQNGIQGTRGHGPQGLVATGVLPTPIAQLGPRRPGLDGLVSSFPSTNRLLDGGLYDSTTRSRFSVNTADNTARHVWIRFRHWMSLRHCRCTHRPVSRFYVTSGNQGLNWIVKGSRALSFPQQHWFIDSGFVFGEHAIAVAKTVRTLGTNFVGRGLPPSQGAEYRRTGAYTGTAFTYPIDAASLTFLDATTDGSHIYAVSFDTAEVYRMDMTGAIR